MNSLLVGMTPRLGWESCDPHISLTNQKKSIHKSMNEKQKGHSF